ncbi:hypothetical protein C1646_776171 [Rhizophagus diaphanus]|nr:hypothetical protein C1646_776171 [Rhizophagus diaphanus] [Rhizophagus sp. MUCL 43196]
MSGAHLLIFDNSTIQFDQLLTLSFQENSIIYKQDVIKLDRQDNNAVYRVFCSKNLAQVLDREKGLSFEFRRLFVYLFVMGYDFNEYAEINLLNNNLECLRYWPSDIKIDNTISIGYERTIHLAKYLEITAVPNAYYFNIHKRFLDLQLDDFWDDNSNPRIMDNPKFNCNYILDGELNVDFFLDLHQSHDAYMSRNLKRIKTVFRNNETNTLDKLDVNITSNLVSYLTKNDDSTLTKSQENR